VGGRERLVITAWASSTIQPGGWWCATFPIAGVSPAQRLTRLCYTKQNLGIRWRKWVSGAERSLDSGRRVRLERMCPSCAEHYDCPLEVATGVIFYGVSRCVSSLVHTLIHFLTYQTGKYGPGSNSPTRYIIVYRPGGITTTNGRTLVSEHSSHLPPSFGHAD
jgi:hypothetical protein